MAKNIKFNIKLNVDGRDQLVIATTNVRDFQKAVRDGSQGVLSFASRFNNLGIAATSARSIIKGSVEAVDGLTQSYREFAGAMAAANTMAGKTGEDFAKMKAQVAGLAEQIPIARDALAKGLYQVVSNGVPEDNWISYLEASAKASVGGIADLEEVVKVTSTVIKNYGLEWSDAAEIQDKIQLTAKNGVTSFEQMAQALPRVAANAATLGISVDELMASFATLTGVSGNTNEVATQMAAIMNALVKPSSEAANMAKEVGVQFDAAAVKAAGGFQNFLVQLQSAVKEYSAASGKLETEVYGRLFGSAEALRAFIPLTGELSEKFAQNAAEMQNSAGTIEGAFGIMSSTGAAALLLIKNRLANVTDGLAAVFAEISPVVNGFATFGNAVTPLLILPQTVGKAAVAQKLLTSETLRSAAAHIAFAGNGTRVAAAMRVMAASTHSAAAATVAMKVALRGLLVATGVGAALAVLGAVVGALWSEYDKAAQGAEKLTAAQAAQKAAAEKQAQGQQTLAAASAELVAKFQALQTQWKALKTEGEKKKFINENKSAFEELGLHIDSVNSAYNTFVTNAPKVVEALKSIAKAEAYKELYKDAIKDKAKNYDPTAKYKRANAGDQVQMLSTAEILRLGKGDYTTSGVRVLTKQGAATINAYRANKVLTAKREEGKVYDDRIAEYGKGFTEAANDARQAQAFLADGAGKKNQNGMRGGGKITPAKTDTKTDTRTPLQKAKDEARFTFERSELPAPDTIAALKERQAAIETAMSNTADPQTLARLGEELAGVTTQIENLQKAAGQVRLSPEEQAAKDRKQQEFKAAIIQVDMPAEPRNKTEEKRNAYRKAEGDISAVKWDYDIGLIGTDEALSKIGEINDALKELGLQPIEVQIDPKVEDGGLKEVADSISQVGSSLSAMGQNLEMPELEVTGTVASAIGSLIQGYAAATVQATTLGPWAWIAFAVAGLATLTSVVASIQNMGSYATGGVIGGGSTFGDKKFARVNSGEMILNKFQQASLFKMIDGGYVSTPSVSLPAAQSVSLNVNALGSQLYTPQEQFGAVRFRLQGRDLVGSVANTTRLGGKSGRASNIKI